MIWRSQIITLSGKGLKTIFNAQEEHIYTTQQRQCKSVSGMCLLNAADCARDFVSISTKQDACLYKDFSKATACSCLCSCLSVLLSLTLPLLQALPVLPCAWRASRGPMAARAVRCKALSAALGRNVRSCLLTGEQTSADCLRLG